MIKICISKDFSDVLGGRFRTDGKFSGEEFFEELLEQKYNKAVEHEESLVIDLDGTFGYPSSFIDQSFGELGRKYGEKNVQKTLVFISEDQPNLETKIRNYIHRGSKHVKD